MTPPDVRVPAGNGAFRLWRAALHIAALWTLAVAAPLYDVLRGNREFFVAYRAERGEILLLVATWSVIAPLVIALLTVAARAAGVRAARVVTAVVVGLLAALLAAQIIRSVDLPDALHVVVATVAGIGGGALYARRAAVRFFVTWLTPAVVIVPLVFLLHPAMRAFVAPDHERVRVDAPPSDTPVVIVVFDQLPLTSLIGADGTIDAASYPGFAGLARTSTWYRGATTVADLTGWALPAVLSGVRPRAEALPTARDYPGNVFALLGHSHRMDVAEQITSLCPRDLCPAEGETLMNTNVAMSEDAAVIIAHRIVPSEIRARLPALTENWRGFLAAEDVQGRWVHQRDRDRRRIVNRFITGIQRTDAVNTLYFLHALLPHEPYIFLPDGTVVQDPREPIGIPHWGVWPGNAWNASQAYARHLLQLQFVDSIVARLVARLHEEGLFDRSLIVVTSDHGVSFVPGLPMKEADERTIRDVMPVPLIVKAPFQTQGVIDDRNVESIDVLPTVASLLGVRLPFTVDGRSLTEPFSTELPTKTIFRSMPRQSLTVPAGMVAASAERRIALFGTGPGPYWSSTAAPRRDLIDRRLDTLTVNTRAGVSISIDRVEQLRDIDPGGASVPALLSGRVTAPRSVNAPLMIAVAVNGQIAATTLTFDAIDGVASSNWLALVNPARYRKQHNDIRVYMIEEHGGRTVLIEGFAFVQPPRDTTNR